MSAGSTTEKLSREAIAQREIGQTDISPRLARLLTVVFLVTLIVPPTVQAVYDVTRGGQQRTLSCLELFHALPEVGEAFHHTEGSLWQRVLTANHQLVRGIEEYERKLLERSLITQHLLGPTQQYLTGLAGLGNEKAYVGRDGWLYYRPDVDYLTGSGFLEPSVLHRRSVSGKQHLTPPQPDPRPCILEFHTQLARRGIRLIVMPVPNKSAIHPEYLSSRYDEYPNPLENESFRQFKLEMDRAGVLMFDPAPILKSRYENKSADGGYLRTDTHWTPGAMERVAEKLKGFIDDHCRLPQITPLALNERIVEVNSLGDIGSMLHLPPTQTLFQPEKVKIREVIGANGHRWQADEQADVLLLGDSYTNIYSLSEMNWGAAAGLAERLSFALRRPIDRLAQNDGGSHAVRQALYQQLARGHDRLKGKRVVIWEFAVRELAFGDWKSFPMPDPPAVEAVPADTSTLPGQIVISATVRAAAGAPEPGSVPYRDAVSGVHLDGVQAVQGSFDNHEIIAYSWGLRDNRRMPAAGLVSNQKVKLRLTPWDAVRDKYERFNRIELDDPDFRLAELPVYWAEEIP